MDFKNCKCLKIKIDSIPIEISVPINTLWSLGSGYM